MFNSIYGIIVLGLVMVYITYCIVVYKRLKKRQQTDLTSLILIAEDIKGELNRRKYMITNNKNLAELLQETGIEQDYNDFVDKVVKLVKKQYEEYRFQLGKPAKDDFESGYNLFFSINVQEFPEEHEELFRLAVRDGLKIDKINDLFVEKVKDGQVIELGEDIVITEEETGMTTILQGGEVQVFINYRTEEEVEKAKEQAKEREEEEEKQRKEFETKQKARETAYTALNEATKALQEATDEVKEKYPELPLAVERAQDAYKELLD